MRKRASRLLTTLVLRENSYGGSTIETVADQKVISSGPYTLVRHPMHGGVPLALLARVACVVASGSGAGQAYC